MLPDMIHAFVAAQERRAQWERQKAEVGRRRGPGIAGSMAR